VRKSGKPDLRGQEGRMRLLSIHIKLLRPRKS
jgi:hypothetical protein